MEVNDVRKCNTDFLLYFFFLLAECTHRSGFHLKHNTGISNDILHVLFMHRCTCWTENDNRRNASKEILGALDVFFSLSPWNHLYFISKKIRDLSFISVWIKCGNDVLSMHRQVGRFPYSIYAKCKTQYQSDRNHANQSIWFWVIDFFHNIYIVRTFTCLFVCMVLVCFCCCFFFVFWFPMAKVVQPAAVYRCGAIVGISKQNLSFYPYSCEHIWYGASHV